MKKKFKIFDSAVVIGPSGIGKAHLRELINFGIKKISVLGKKYKKDRLKIEKKKYKNVNFFNLKKIQEIKKFKPDIINICSPTKFHLNHIKLSKKISNRIIVEKPLIWSKDKKNLNSSISKKLLNANKIKIFVNFPMISLANQLKKYENNKIKQLTFSYFTNGKNKHNDIGIDLLPHAFSFVLTLLNFRLSSFKIITVEKKINSWNCKIQIKNCVCNFYFKQNIKKKFSEMKFSINENSYTREQYLKNGIYINTLIKNNKKKIQIKNPMTDNLKYILKNIDSKVALKKNNKITIDSIKLTEKLINYKKI